MRWNSNRDWIALGIIAGALAGWFAIRKIHRRPKETAQQFDPVALASELSFPASDAPSWTPTLGTGTPPPSDL